MGPNDIGQVDDEPADSRPKWRSTASRSVVITVSVLTVVVHLERGDAERGRPGGSAAGRSERAPRPRLVAPRVELDGPGTLLELVPAFGVEPVKQISNQ